jgi:adhesin transport system outer membrane protein
VRYRLTPCVAACLIGLLAPLVHAAPVSLEQALSLAVKEHPSIAARISERRAAASKLDLAERQRYPGLSAQTNLDGAGARVTTLRVEQTLWSGGRITGEIDAARAGIRQAGALVTQAEQDIMLKVVNAFTELGRVQARQVAARSNVDEHTRLVNMIQRRVDSQVSPASDGVQAQSRMSQANAELIQLDALALRAKASLAQAIGQRVESIELPQSRSMDDFTLASMMTLAMDFSPALQRLESEQEAAEAEIRIRRSGAYPQLKMRLDHTRGGSMPSTQVYLALDVQTGAGFSIAASVRESEARRDAIRSQIEATRRDITETVQSDWVDLRSLERQKADLATQVETTTTVFDSFVRQYAVGRKGWNDVLNAQREVAQARFQLADAEWGALRAAMRLQLTTGITATEIMAGAGRLPAPATAALPVEVVSTPEPLPIRPDAMTAQSARPAPVASDRPTFN